MPKKKEKEIWEQGMFKIFDFVQNSSISKVSKKLRIDGWHPISQLFLYFFLFGGLLLLLTIFNVVAWIFMWVYVIMWIIALGFIFAKTGQKYRITYVFSAFIILFFFTGTIGRITFNMMDLTAEEQEIQDNQDDAINSYQKYLELIKTNNRAEIESMDLAQFRANLELTDVVIESMIDFTVDDYDSTADYEKAVIKAICDYYDTNGFFFDLLIEEERRKTEFDFTDVWEDMQDLNKNPFDDIESYVTTFFDVINWIVFLFIIGLIGGVIGSVYTLQFDKAVTRGGFIAMAIAFMMLYYGIFSFADIPVRTIWDTVGNAWGAMLGALGFTSLDITGDRYVSPSSIHSGLSNLFPVIVVFLNLGLAISFRKTAFNSIMYVKSLKDDNMIEIKRGWTIKPSALAMLLVVVVAMAGYVLTTADPLGNDPIVQLMFFVGSIVVLLLIGTGDLILNEKVGALKFVKRTCIWCLYGIMLLYLWFLVFQPTTFNMGLVGDQSGILFMSQDQQLLESSFFEQFFTVCMPETLIFQVAFVGVSRRLFFVIGKGRQLDVEDERLKEKRKSLIKERSKIRRIIATGTREDLIAVTKYVKLTQQIDIVRLEIKEKTKIPFRKVLFSGLFGALIGSFFFSWYHSFRMGFVGMQGLLDWWQNPLYGMTYFGAGMILSLVSMFSWIGAILVHFFNNVLAMWLAGAL